MKQNTKTIGKRALALCMSVLMLMTAWVFAPPSKAAADFDVWDGTWDGSGFSGGVLEFTITSAKGFAQFINNVSAGTSYSGKTVHLDVDIDLNSIDFGNVSGGKNVYSDITNYFEGMFEGHGHTIANFSMHSSDHRAALFRCARNAIFKDLTFTNVLVGDNGNNNKNGFAVLVGYGKGRLSFTNVHVESGSVSGCNYVGGFVGEYDDNDALTFENCSNGAEILANGERAGGLVAHSKGSVTALSCSNTGEITAADSDAGGIAGWIEDDGAFFMECANSGSVIGGACAGGIFGYVGNKSQNKNVTIDSCTNSGDIESAFSNVAYAAGGIAGKIETNGEHSIINNVNTGDVHAKGDAGGIVGSNFGSGVWTNNNNSGKVSCDTDNAGGIVGEVEDDKQTFTNCYNAAEVTGHFSTGGIVGYIGTANGNEFTDCGNTGAILSTNGSAGGILGVGKKLNTFSGCFNIASIKGNNNSGGIEGFNDGYHAIYKKSFNAGSVEQYNSTGKNYGGIVGQVNVIGSNSTDANEMEECYNWGAVNGGCAGGLIGYINGGSSAYDIGSSYNTGAVTGTSQAQPFVGSGGNLNGNCFQSISSGAGNYKTPDEMERYNFTVSSSFVKNTWGVRIGDTTYKYPVLTWYRDMFTFETKFLDEATDTDVTYLNTLGESFTVPSPTREGYGAGHWLSGNTHRLVPGVTVTVGDYLTNTNNDKTVDAVNTNSVIHSFSIPTEVRCTKTYTLTWEAGATANMFAMMAVEDENNPNNRTRSGIDYTIHNLTTGHDSYFSAANGDATEGHSNYFQNYYSRFCYNTYQTSGAGSATATLEVDRSRYNKIEDTGVYIEYYPFVYTSYGRMCWGVEIFDPEENISKYGYMNDDYCEADVRSTERNYYTYKLHFGSVDGPLQCSVDDDGIKSELIGYVDAEQRGGPYQWYFTGNAPNVDESVTLRVTALCGARYVYKKAGETISYTDLNILSAYTDVTITGVCSHSNGHLKATAAKAATCTRAGNSAYWHCDVCGKYFSDAGAQHEYDENGWVIPATGHTYGEPVWAWGEGYGSAAATFTCEKNDDTQTVDAAVTAVPTPDATCTADGVRVYTATVEFNGTTYTATQNEPIAATGHSYGEPVWTWSEDRSSATATFTCEKNDDTQTVSATVTAVPTPDATCTEDGVTVYTATAEFNGTTYTTTQNVRIPPTGHSYGEPVWTWSKSYHSATATFTCEDNDDTQTVNAKVTEVPTPDATCTEDGVMVYTATVEFNGKTYTATQNVPIPAAGHSYGEPVWTWSADHSSVTATVTCSHGDDTQTVTQNATQVEVSAATATADQVVKYTVTVEINGKTYTTETENITVPGTATGDPGQTDEPSNPGTPSQNGKCKWCGKDHSVNFWQRIVGFFHSILYFFAHLFGLR